LNVNDLTGIADALRTEGVLSKYLNLDLSGSTFTCIGNNTFYSCTSLTNITIPDSVTEIDRAVFDDTAWLWNQPDGLIYAGKVVYDYKGTMPANTSIVLLDGTKGIAGYAFGNCYNLINITIPDSVTNIGDATFNNCNKLTSVTIPDNVTSIGNSAFSNCGLTSVIIGNSVIIIDHGAFSNCNSLTSVTFKGLITNFNNYTFRGSEDLRNKYITGGIGTYTRESGGTVWTKQ